MKEEKGIKEEELQMLLNYCNIGIELCKAGIELCDEYLEVKERIINEITS